MNLYGMIDIVDILMFSFFFGSDIEVFCFIFIVEKEKNKVLKFDMISAALF